MNTQDGISFDEELERLLDEKMALPAKGKGMDKDVFDDETSKEDKELLEKTLKQVDAKVQFKKYYYGQMPGTLLKNRDISPGAKLLFCAYHISCERKTTNDLLSGKSYAWISQKELGKILNCDTRSIKRWTKELEKFHYITVERRKGTPSIITLHIPKVEDSKSIGEIC